MGAPSSPPQSGSGRVGTVIVDHIDIPAPVQTVRGLLAQPWDFLPDLHIGADRVPVVWQDGGSEHEASKSVAVLSTSHQTSRVVVRLRLPFTLRPSDLDTIETDVRSELERLRLLAVL